MFNKKIVVIGGGTGIFSVLSGLKKEFKDVTAIVTMADDGGSTGILREDFGILPPGDIRRALVALSQSDNQILSQLFNYRFQEGGGLTGHNFGNLMLTALQRITGDFEMAIEEASKILSVSGRVIPITLRKTKLFAELENHQIIEGESNIDIPRHDGRLKIARIWIKPLVPINPEAERAIRGADLIIIGPGDLYTSLIPNLLVKGVREVLRDSLAKKVYFVNLMTKFGETNGFSAIDFVRIMKEYCGEKVINYVIVNNRRPILSRLRSYLKEGADFVEPVINDRDGFFMVITADLIRARGLVRHDPEKVVRVLKMIV